MDTSHAYIYQRVQPGVWLVILISAGVHACLVAALILAGIRHDRPNDLASKAIITRLLKKGELKPKNWLPDKPVESAPKPPEAVPAPTTKAVTDNSNKTPAPPKTKSVDYKKDMKNALASLQRDGRKNSKEAVAGSPEGVEEGDSLIAQLGDVYLTQIYKLIKSNYVLPDIINDRERLFLVATVVITVNAKGHIIELTFEKRSGNNVFDSAIETAIRKTAPFPAPPKELVSKYEKDGIGLNFRP